MASFSLPTALRGLVLSAADLRSLTNWPDALIEDYLNIVDNLLILSSVINQKSDLLKVTSLVDASMSPYEIKASDEEVIFDLSAGDIIANLQAGVEGREYRLVGVSIGSGTTNKVTLNPYGTELLFGENAAEFVYDGEALIITYNATQGWN